jgi:hypothetical protein
MCEYISGVITLDNRILFGKLNSHSGIAEGWSLRPGTYREFEWVGNDADSLTVRVEDDEKDSTYIAIILSQYNTRKELVNSITECRYSNTVVIYDKCKLISISNLERDLDLSDCSDLISLPDNLTVNGNLDLTNCNKLVSLPDNLTINYLDLDNCHNLISLSDNLTVKGSLNLTDCKNLISLPDKLNINGNLYLKGTNLNIKKHKGVGGKIYN